MTLTTKRKLIYVIAISLLSTLMCGSAYASDSTWSPQITCLDIRAKYPEGIAKNKKAAGLRRFPKAKIDPIIYAANTNLDSNETNGIICDKKESFQSYSTGLQLKFVSQQIDLVLRMRCEFRIPEIDYRASVGYAILDFKVKCLQLITNLDPHYSFELNWYPEMYLVYDEIVTDPDDGSIRKASDEIYTTPDLYRTIKSRSEYSRTYNSYARIEGRRTEIETLYSKIKNGLEPRFFLSFFLGKPSGCFANAKPRSYEAVQFTDKSGCNNFDEQTETTNRVWDL